MEKLERKKKRKLEKEQEQLNLKEVSNNNTAPEDQLPKKKKKDTSVNDEDKLKDSKPSQETEENLPFKKAFYTMNQVTEARSKQDVKTFREKHCITLYGKGRKEFKPVLTFPELGFSKKIMKICNKFEKPTPIQSECWPILGSGKDIIGIAETGSGKTLAFTLPALVHIRHRIEEEPRKRKGPILLIISPTRELAMQSQVVLEEAADAVQIKSVCVYGGVPKYNQMKDLSRGVEVVVATPGRLIDLMNEGCCDLSEVSYLVLDEADRMLDQGFERDIRRIISETHPQRQTALFSATWPDSVRELAHEFLNKPIKVTIGSDDLAAGTRIKQIVEVIEDRAREAIVEQIIKELSFHQKEQNTDICFVQKRSFSH